MSITYLGVEQLKGYDDENWTEGIETFDFTLSDKSNKCYSYHGPVIGTRSDAKVINNSHTLKLSIPFSSDINYYQKVALELPIIVESDAKLSIHTNNKTVPVSTRIISSEHIINTIPIQGPTESSQDDQTVSKETLNTICFDVTDEFENYKSQDIDLVLYIDYGPDSQNQKTGVKILLQDIEITSIEGKKKLSALGFSLSQSWLGWTKLSLFSLLFFTLIAVMALLLLKFSGLLKESPVISIVSSVVAGLSLLFRVQKKSTYKPTVQQAFKYSYLKWQQWGSGYIVILITLLGICVWALYEPFYCIYTEYTYKSEIKKYIEKEDKISLYNAFNRSPWRREAPILLSQMIYKELDLFSKRNMKNNDTFSSILKSIRPAIVKLHNNVNFGCECLNQKKYINKEQYNPLIWYSIILYDIASEFNNKWVNSSSYLDLLSEAIYSLNKVTNDPTAELIKLSLQTKLSDSYQTPYLTADIYMKMETIYKNKPEISSQYYLFIHDFMLSNYIKNIVYFVKDDHYKKYIFEIIDKILIIQNNCDNHKLNNKNKKDDSQAENIFHWMHSPTNLTTFKLFNNIKEYFSAYELEKYNKAYLQTIRKLMAGYDPESKQNSGIQKRLDNYYKNKKRQKTSQKYLVYLNTVRKKDLIPLLFKEIWIGHTVLKKQWDHSIIYSLLQKGWRDKI